MHPACGGPVLSGGSYGSNGTTLDHLQPSVKSSQTMHLKTVGQFRHEDLKSMIIASPKSGVSSTPERLGW
jgi:hypothetical protein